MRAAEERIRTDDARIPIRCVAASHACEFDAVPPKGGRLEVLRGRSRKYAFARLGRRRAAAALEV